MKCFCVPNRNYWVSGMVELSLHPLLSGSTIKVSLWSFLFDKACAKQMSLRLLSFHQIWGSRAVWEHRQRACCCGAGSLCPIASIFCPGISISAGHHCLTPQPTKTNPHFLGTVRHASRRSPTNCPFSNFFTPPTAKGAQGQKLKQMHLPARHLVLSEASPTNT